MVFQSYALFPHLNVHDNIAFGLRRHKVKEPEVKARVAEALELVHLGGLRPAQARTSCRAASSSASRSPGRS